MKPAQIDQIKQIGIYEIVNTAKVANKKSKSYKGLIFKWRQKTAPYNGDIIVELGELLESLKR